MPNLKDLMTPEDRELVKSWAEKRLKPKYKQDIPPGLFICGQLGYYYGWQAVVDFRRGYHVGITDDGKFTKMAFTFEDAVGLVEAASKVHYRLKTDEARMNSAHNASVYDKEYGKANAKYVENIERKAFS